MIELENYRLASFMTSGAIPLNCESAYPTFFSFLRPTKMTVSPTKAGFIKIVKIESRCTDGKFAIVAFPNITDRHDNLP
jgi:hypothetical protein